LPVVAAGNIPEKIRTGRLLLHRFLPGDAREVCSLMEDPSMGAGLLTVPCPYSYQDASDWIENHQEWWERGEQYIFAITGAPSGALAGAVSLRVNPGHGHAEMGYWVGRPFQGKGYATEAARAVLEFGFFCLDLHRIYGRHLAWNGAPGRIFARLGMRHEGTLRGHALKWGVWHDVEVWGILRSKFLAEVLGAGKGPRCVPGPGE